MPPHLHLALNVLAWLLAITWLAKAITTNLGLRRLPNLLSPAFNRAPASNPAIIVIVPACNEQANLRSTLESLLAQDHKNLHILAINDRSTDQTGPILHSLAAQHPTRLTALHIDTLPPGWLGKTHAMSLAARHALAMHQPAWLLFTDADVLFHPEAIRRSLVAAELTHADHFITLPTPITHSAGEAMLLGFFQIMGFFAIRLWRVADPRSLRDSVGVGAFALVRSSAYQQIGGFDAIRLEILEDLAFGQRIKQAGLAQRVALAPALVRVHWAPGAFGLVDVLTKNLFALFRFSPLLLLGAIASILGLGLGPVLALVYPATRLPALLTLVAIASMYRLAHRISGNPVQSFFLFPVATLLLAWSLLKSMVVTLRHGGVTWRGTFYPLADLRRNASHSFAGSSSEHPG